MIIQPISYLFQPPAAGAALTTVIRNDPSASFVTLALPGTKFSNFGQNLYRSDISGYINGGSNLADMALTGSGQFASASICTSGSFAWADDGYTNSMSKGTLSNYGTLPAGASPINFGTGDWTIELFFNRPSGGGESNFCWGYNNSFGFFLYSGTYFRWIATPGGADLSLGDVTHTIANNTWHHVFMSRKGGTFYGGFDGYIRAQANSGTTINNTTPVQIGGSSGGASATWLIQDFRITKGACRYAGANGSAYTIPRSIVTLG